MSVRGFANRRINDGSKRRVRGQMDAGTKRRDELAAAGPPDTNRSEERLSGDGRVVSRPSIPVDWEALARSTAHLLRVSILEILGIDGGRVMSATELAFELQIPLSNTNYHVTELAKAGLIVEVDRRAVRGATEHFHRLAASS